MNSVVAFYIIVYKILNINVPKPLMLNIICDAHMPSVLQTVISSGNMTMLSKICYSMPIANCDPIMKYLASSSAHPAAQRIELMVHLNTKNGAPFTKVPGIETAGDLTTYYKREIIKKNELVTIAAKFGQIKILDFLIKNNCPISPRNCFPILKTIKNHDMKTFMFLLNCTSSFPPEFGPRNLIVYAITHKFYAAVDILISRRYYVGEWTLSNQCEALCKNADLTGLMRLRELGALFCANYHGVIKMAMHYGHLEILDYLCKHTDLREIGSDLLELAKSCKKRKQVIECIKKHI